MDSTATHEDTKMSKQITSEYQTYATIGYSDETDHAGRRRPVDANGKSTWFAGLIRLEVKRAKDGTIMIRKTITEDGRTITEDEYPATEKRLDIIREEGFAC